MSTIAIVGGHGEIARLLIDELVRGGHMPVALVRSEGQRAELMEQGAQVRLLDIEAADVEQFAAAFDGADAVVFTAGGGGDGNVRRKQTVDLGGSVKSASGAKQAGVRRFVQVSAMGVDDDPADDAEEAWKAYVLAKRDADAGLRASGLDWTIVRPGRLTDDAATGTVQVGATLGRGSVTRADVAAVLAAVLEDDDTIGAQFDLVEGDRPVREAVASLHA